LPFNSIPFDSVLLSYTVSAIIVGGFVGIGQATLLWLPYKLAGIRLRKSFRLIICALLFSMCSALLRETGGIAGSIQVLVSSLPIGLVVGSSIRPWNLFTFGSTSTSQINGIQTVNSTSIIATVAGLPLRIVSIASIGLWILYTESVWLLPGKLNINNFLFGVVPLVYLITSAYFTLRSTRRILLIGVSVLINAPVAFLAYSCYRWYPDAYWLGDLPLVIAFALSLFVVLWAVFLGARLFAPFGDEVESSLSILDDAS